MPTPKDEVAGIEAAYRAVGITLPPTSFAPANTAPPALSPAKRRGATSDTASVSAHLGRASNRRRLQGGGHRVAAAGPGTSLFTE
jgi:hypothetical protein